jgi:predicted nucleic acid-binding protein
MTTAFLDSSVFFTAVNSVTGGSAKLFTLKKYQLVTSQAVLVEVERNVRQKLLPAHLKRFFNLATKLRIINQQPIPKLINQAQKVIVKKDALILAEAKQAKANFLVTLDRKHFLKPQPRKFVSPQKIVTPKDLL